MKRDDEDALQEPAGFTLVELLTVIVVIAILIGFLLPALSNIRERARCAKCVANLKQLHQAAMNYATDYATLPAGSSVDTQWPDGTYTTNAIGWLTWFNHPADMGTYFSGARGKTCITNGTLYAYLQDMRVYLCPTFSQFKVCNIADPVRSYGMCDQASGANIYAIRNASRLLLFSEQSNRYDAQLEYGKFVGDGNDSYWTLNDAGWGQFSPAPGRSYQSIYKERRRNIGFDGIIDGYSSCGGWGGAYVLERIGAYHDGRANCIFVDGHTEKIFYTNTQSVCSGTWGGVD